MIKLRQPKPVPFLLKTACVPALVALWGILGADTMPTSTMMVAYAASERAAKAAKSPKETLSALRVFNRSMLLMKDNYVDPQRIDPKKMLVSALDAVERQAAEVMVQGDEKDDRLVIVVGDAQTTLDIGRVDNLWTMGFAMKSAMDFVAAHLALDGKNDVRDIEYAAVNGMLSTLDPHSTMMKSEYFKEMSLQSKGEFGGLGFVLQMREGELTIVRVMKDTPAKRAGLKSKDVITRINGESMVNADLNEAVNRLRGKPGTKVTVTVKRSSWKAPKDMTIERAVIKFDSIQSKLLEGGVGYVRVKAFQNNTTSEVKAHLKSMAEKAGKSGLKGLVLDLRGNPGGLLDQAVALSDLFLSSGEIVTTVGYSSKLREGSRAKSGDSEEKLPLIVLANSSSASASEIVSGALKNNDRAMVVGRQTFGKGSVQVLYDRFPDDGALKLTIAQYLTPGGKSIQEVGITPDIELVPGRIGKERLDFFAPERKTSEADLEQHLGNPDAEAAVARHEDVVRKEQPLETFLYLREAPRARPDSAWRKPAKAKSSGDSKEDKAAQQEEDLDVQDMAEFEGIDPDTDEIVEDFPIRFARQVILGAPVPSRSGMLEGSADLRAKLRGEEASRVAKAIDMLGVDWSAPEAATAGASGDGKSALKVEMSPAGTFRAGETVDWKVSVTNGGSHPVYRLKAYSDTDNAWFDRREFIFGKLKPGEARDWTVKVRLPKDLPSRREPVTLHFSDAESETLLDYKGEVSVVEIPHPAFAFSWKLFDACPACNGDGMLQKGETVALDIDVTNVGEGTSHETIASVRNKDFEEGLSLIKARTRMGELKPGETKRVHFEFELKESFDKPEAVIQVVLSDEETGEWVVDVASFPVSGSTMKPGEKFAKEKAAYLITSTAPVPILSAADGGASVLATLPAGTELMPEGRVGDYARVRFMADGKDATTGFVPMASMEQKAATPKELKAFVPPSLPRTFMRHAPLIHIDGVDLKESGIVTDQPSIALKGSASNVGGLRDLYVFVNNQKVFFKAADKGGATAIPFDASIPLKEGKNVIHVVARENREVQSYKMLIVSRRPLPGADEKASAK